MILYFVHPGMVAISDSDILFVAKDCNLSIAQLEIFYMKLGLTESEIEAAKYKTAGGGIHSIHLQAVDVLRSWRRDNGNNATRMELIRVLHACGYHTQVQMLEQKWGIIFLDGTCVTGSTLHSPKS